MVGLGSQLSVKVGVAGAGIASHDTVVLSGKVLKIGAVLSCTVITWVCVMALAQASVAVQVRVRVYDPVQLPFVLASVLVIVGAEPQLSVAVTVAMPGMASHDTVWFAGSVEVHTGGVRSCTVMVWTIVAVFPQVSLAVQVRFNW